MSSNIQGADPKGMVMVNWLVVILIPEIMIVFLSFGYDPEMNIFYYLSFFIVPVMMIFVIRYLFSPDKHYCYHFYEDFPVLGEDECIQSYMEAHPSKALNDE